MIIEMFEKQSLSEKLRINFKQYPLSTVVALAGLLQFGINLVLFLAVAIAAGLLEAGFKKLVKGVVFLYDKLDEAKVASYRSKGIL